MPLPTVYWLTQIGKVMGRLFPAIGTVTGLVTLIYDLGEQMLAAGLNFALDHISAIDTSAFSNISFAGIASIGLANAVFPLSEAVTIWAALGTAMMTIIVIRWIKSFIPTVAN